jgi:membrane associated rhomboid family serine protease
VSNYLDYEALKKDKRSRIYSVNFKTRNIGKLSWTSRLVWANVLVFLLQTCRPSVTSWGINLSDRIRSGRELYRTITPVFLHGNIFHLGTNMISLQRTGGDVEKLFGGGRYLASYLVAGIAGNFVSAWSSPNPSLGASGAVFGVVGAYFIFLNRNEWLLGDLGASMTNSITQTIAANLLLGAFNPVIDNWAHLGGALGGAAMAYLFGPRLYLTELPESGRQILVDRPVVRLPRAVEQLPERLGTYVNSILEKLPGLPQQSPKPWRNGNFRRPKAYMPTRSLKPLPVD